MKLRHRFSATLFISLMWLGSAAYGADPESENVSEDDVDVSETTEQEAEVFATEDNEEASTPVEDRFIPSAQISEDLSVSFPVNI